jgi:very-short-patch-repair endonuclease
MSPRLRDAPANGVPLSPNDKKSPCQVKVLGVRGLFTVSGSRDQRIAAIAGLQRGRIARRQLSAAGVSDSTIARMCRDSWLHREHWGVYAVGHLAPIELAPEAGALLAVGDDSILSHLTAAALWRLYPPRLQAPVDIVVARDSGRRPGIRVHRSARLDGCDVRIHHGLPVTSPARTLLDIAGVLTEDELEQALDDALSQNLVRPAQIRDVLTRLSAGRAGARRLARLLDSRTRGRPALTRSRAERILRELTRKAQLPPAELNAPLHGFRVDALWREHRLVVEVDGYEFHARRANFERDHRRDAILEAQGWTVIRITARQLEDEPYAVVARLAAALAWASARAA